MIRLRHILLTLCAFALVALPAAAFACGACVSPPKPPGQTGEFVVLQNAERVLFYEDDKTGDTVAWVEVRYQGLAENFGWVLPVPKVPKVGVGSALVFDLLDDRMAARYTLQNKGDENCLSPHNGCARYDYPTDYYNVQDASANDDTWAGGSSGGSSSGGGGSSVVVVDSGQAGPYDYVVVKGSDATELQAWLNKNKYITPKEATPIIDSHIKKGDVFVAIRLQNGQGVSAIQPVVLRMKDAEPCVPLRLTSVAATADMSVIVTVAGSGRAVVKNHLDVTINPLKLNLFKNANNYSQVVSEAIDEAGGHAFVTEASLAGSELLTIAPSGMHTAGLSAATNLQEFAQALNDTGNAWLFAEGVDTMEAAGGLSKVVPGDKSPADAISWLWTCGNFWNQLGPNSTCNWQGQKLSGADAQQIPVDGAKIGKALEAIKAAVSEVSAALKASKQVTRMVLRIDPQEMDRDPVFAFATDNKLPDVNNKHEVFYRRICDNGWSHGKRDQTRLITALGSWVLKGNFSQANAALDPRFQSAPFALSIAVHEEAGPPIPIAKEQAELVDATIAGAQPGKKSLPDGFSLKKATPWEPPADDPPYEKMTPWCPPSPYCVWQEGWAPGKIPPNWPGAGTGPGASYCSQQGINPADPSGDGGSGGGSGGGCSAAQGDPGPGSAGFLLVLAAIMLVGWRSRRAAR